LKSVAFAPLIDTLVTDSAALPIDSTLSVCGELAMLTAWVPKLTGFGVNAMPGATPLPETGTSVNPGPALCTIRKVDPRTPNPVSVTVCGELVALPLTINVAVRAPRADGVNVMLRPHELPGGTFWPAQVLATLKSPALTPTTVTPVTVNPESPTLSTLTVCGALAKLTACVPKFT